MSKLIKYFIAASAVLGSFGGVSPTNQSHANEPTAVTASPLTGDFTKKRYTIHGNWSLTKESNEIKIRFLENFKTKSGPDLKIFLSPKPIEQLSPQTAMENARKIGILKSNQGEQNYSIPDGINLNDYKSVIIHCEAYSVLWGGFDIPE